MKSRAVFSHKKNCPYLGTKDSSHGTNTTAFFSQPGEVHSATFERIYDEFTNELKEDWTFLGESQDWELISSFGPAT